ncbi:MAG: glutamate synthase subunit alpha, partial [Actinomycetota bacterium]|nr:glutamate synthase subunit alpha [Actinomycetota bacterium]
MLFLDPDDPRAGRAVTEQACAAEGLVVQQWRSVPVDHSALGRQARATAPVIEQALVASEDGDTDERRAFRARRRLEQAARRAEVRVYVSSLSFRTVTYKALCAADQLGQFYGDLVDPRCEAWFALFHQRYSTNTAPSWERAQPLRYLAHNGEINTIRGNVAAIAGRAGRLGTTGLAPEELLDPVVDVDGSDSAVLDEVLELLVHGGRDLDHAAAMLLPQAWEQRDDIASEVRDFFHYHSCLLEPWDGPAALVMSDGIRIAACLDRNGLRPLRLSLCEDGLVACASEAGAVDTRGRGLVARRRLGPGELFVVDPSDGGILFDQEIKTRLGRQRPYGNWLRENLRRASCGEPVASVRAAVTPRQVAMGYTKEEITVVLRPMATEGQEPTSSMGDDTAQPPLAEHARPIPAFLKQRFAQITNPPIDHLRERDVMSLTTKLGPRGALLRAGPDAAAVREYASFLLYPSALEELEQFGARSIDATFDVGDGPEGLRAACVRAADEAEDVVRSGAPYLVVTDRAASPDRVAVPATLAAGAVHHRLLRTRLRSLTALVVESDEPRDAHHIACLVTNGVDAVCPRLALDSIVDLARRGRLGGHVTAEEAQRRYFQAVEEGLLKVMSKMGISTLDSYRGGQIIEAIGLGRDVIDLCFDGVNSMLGGF